MNDATHHVVRGLRLDSAPLLQRGSETVRAIEGVVSVAAEGPQRLRITYDFTRLTWLTLCDRLKRAGLYTPKRWWMRWRDAWRDQLDHNRRENLRHQAACCSKPPPGAGRR